MKRGSSPTAWNRHWGLLVLAGIGMVCVGTSLAAEMRTWTDDSGSHQIKARLVRPDGEKVILEREDGKQVPVDRQRLSKADQQYLDQNLPQSENPFQRVDDSTALGRDPEPAAESKPGAKQRGLVGVRWTSVKPINPVPKGEWQFTLDEAVPEAPVSHQIIAVPPKRNFFERFSGLVVNEVAGRAIISYHSDKAPPDKVTRLVLCNLCDGRSVQFFAPGKMAPVALSDSGTEVLMRADGHVAENADFLELWTLTSSGVDRTLAWYPSENKLGGGQDIRWAQFLAKDRFVTFSGSGMLVVWQLNPLKPVWGITIDGRWIPAMSRDRNYVVCSANDEIGVLDLRTGKVLAVKSHANAMQGVFAFSPSGRRLACMEGENLVVWDFATGEKCREVLLAGRGVGRGYFWVDDSNVMLGDGLLFDVDRQIKLWAYENVEAVAYCRGVPWFLVQEMRERASGLVPLEVPHPEARETLKAALDDPELYVLRPGVTVRLVLDGVGEAARENVRDILSRKLKANNCAVGPKGTIDLVASVEQLPQREITLAPLFHIGGAKTFKFRRYRIHLKLVYEQDELWHASHSNLPEVINLHNGESLEQWLWKHEKPDFDWCEKVDLPKYLTKAKCKRHGTLGSSQMTADGLE